ncbi:unnamed protein product [Rotaria magnacalcarata]|uniref:Diacylglycerol kinase n=1 Tax=Rotaria magnacalcarata TaxID=392030 RepID=A0A815YIW9_9BILA|nr:unnamed protein product [Rotaria magnacalcarata]
MKDQQSIRSQLSSGDLKQQHSSDYRISTTEQSSMAPCAKQKAMGSTPILTNTTQTFTSASEFDSSLICGIDWSESAHFASHCWLPYSSKNSSGFPLTLAARSHTGDSPLMQCAVCCLILYTTDCSDSRKTVVNVDHELSPCRPSFFDSNTTADISVHDQHYWSYVPTLKERCMQCNRKSLSRPFYDTGNRISNQSTIDHKTRDGQITNHAKKILDENVGKKSNNLVCLWCLRNCHRQCWNSMSDNDRKSKCDYGTFGNIIVRPQWLRRVVGSVAGFRAELIDSEETDTFSPKPVVFFINKLSGGQKSEEVYRKLVRRLNPRQIFLLENDATITQAMRIYSSLANVRICVCGGDGTVGWVLSCLLEIFPTLENPPVTICPLGTGNDLSRVLGWGKQYDIKQLFRTVPQIFDAQPVALDRWLINFETLEMTTATSNYENPVVPQCLCFAIDHPKFVRSTNLSMYEHHLKPINKYFFSHLSFGLDAAIALDFHTRRIRDPSQFTSPLKNKIHYLSESRKYFKEFFFADAWNLGLYMRLICDDQDLTDSIRSCHTLVLMNSPGYAAGTNPWDSSLMNRNDELSTDQTTMNFNLTTGSPTSANRFTRQYYGDRKIEVVGLNTKEMAFIHLGVQGQRIAQCCDVHLELNRPMPAQMDGEPFFLAEPTVVKITHAGQVFVLRNEHR